MTRRELLTLLSAAMLGWRATESENPRLIEYWLLILDQCLGFPAFEMDAIWAASELRLAIEAEGVPENWAAVYRVVCATQFRLSAATAG
jgi:hypothetical protein